MIRTVCLAGAFALLSVNVFGNFDETSNNGFVLATNIGKNGRFEFVVVNLRREVVRLGKLSSVLGYDQFELEVSTKEGKDTIKRKSDMVISLDARTPIELNYGEFFVFKVDVFDGSWIIPDRLKNAESILRIVPRYAPDNCLARELRESHGIWSASFESTIPLVMESGVDRDQP